MASHHRFSPIRGFSPVPRTSDLEDETDDQPVAAVLAVARLERDHALLRRIPCPSATWPRTVRSQVLPRDDPRPDQAEAAGDTGSIRDQRTHADGESASFPCPLQRLEDTPRMTKQVQVVAPGAAPRPHTIGDPSAAAAPGVDPPVDAERGDPEPRTSRRSRRGRNGALGDVTSTPARRRSVRGCRAGEGERGDHQCRRNQPAGPRSGHEGPPFAHGGQRRREG
jgi:hypothetical protein